MSRGRLPITAPLPPIPHPIQSFCLYGWLPTFPPSASLFLMSICHLIHNRCRKQGSLRQRPLRKNATTKRTQASRLPKIAKYQICKTEPRASSSYTARATHPNPQKRTHRFASNRTPSTSRPTRIKRVIQLQYLHRFNLSINYLQPTIVTPPQSVLIIDLGLRRLSRVQFRQRNKPKF